MGKKKKKLPLGWVCPVCGAVWSPVILRCMRFHGGEGSIDEQVSVPRKIYIKKSGSV